MSALMERAGMDPTAHSAPERHHALPHQGWPGVVQSGYALSLWSRYYDYRQHPPFRDYGRGVMASPHTPEKMRADGQMRRLLPTAGAGRDR